MRCTAITKKQKPCKNDAMQGLDVCKSHTGDDDVGRASKLTDVVQAKLVEALEAGNYRETAALYAGIHPATFYRWMDQGQADRDANVDSAHREFCEAVTRAEAEAEVVAVAVIRRAMIDRTGPDGKVIPADHRAAQFFLERKKPKDWGRQERHEVSGPNAGPIVTETNILDGRQPADLSAAAQRKIAEALREEEAGRAARA